MKKYKKKRTSYTPPIFRASFLPHSAERGNPAIWATDENKGGKEKKKKKTLVKQSLEPMLRCIDQKGRRR